MRIVARTIVWCAVVIATGTGLSAQQEDPALDALLTKATWSAIDFVDKLSSVVSEEHYTQDSNVLLATVAIPGLGGRGGPAMSALGAPRNTAS